MTNPVVGFAFLCRRLWRPSRRGRRHGLSTAAHTLGRRVCGRRWPGRNGARRRAPTDRGASSSWLVDNRAGAGGNVGAEIVAKANPDGYTALASTSTVLTVNPSLYRMSFNVERDLQPVTVLSLGEQVVVVHPSVCLCAACRNSSHSRNKSPAPSTMGRPARVPQFISVRSCSSSGRAST